MMEGLVVVPLLFSAEVVTFTVSLAGHTETPPLLLLLPRVGVEGGGTNITALTVPTATDDTDDDMPNDPIPTALILFILPLPLLLLLV